MSYPPYPDNRGKTRTLHDIHGKAIVFCVEDEIVFPEPKQPEKVIYLQRIRWENGSYDLRLCYYMLGVNGRSVGKWVFGQFATFIQSETLSQVFNQARKKGWME